MADNQTMAQFLQAPTVGYEDAIVIPEIAAKNFELKHGLINLVQHKQIFGHDKEDPHAHIRYNKSKVRQSRAKAVVAKVNSRSSTPAISSDVAELKDMVRALLLDKKNQSSALATSPTPAPVKAVESNCVTCVGTHSYQNCPATSGNVYQDNIHDPTPSDDPIISTTSPTLTPFGDSDFLLFEEANAFLGLEDDPDLPKLDPSYSPWCLFVVGLSGGGSGIGVRVGEWQENGESGVVESWRENRVKCYNCKKEGHFSKDCKKAKVKDYEYYKTKMLLAKKDKDEQVLLAEDQAWM
nr:reverse transcriptase domain-containing protein [Tanacetum cinerariifolium]